MLNHSYKCNGVQQGSVPMPCAKCNAAVALEDSTPHEGTGRFKETYECVRGHKGWIEGKEEAPPTEWDRFGSVFQS